MVHVMQTFRGGSLSGLGVSKISVGSFFVGTALQELTGHFHMLSLQIVSIRDLQQRGWLPI